MSRLVFFLVLCVGAWSVLAGFWPAMRTRRFILGWAAVCGLAVAAFALPMLMGRGISGEMPVLGTPAKLFGVGMLAFVLGTTFVGVPMLLLRWVMTRLFSNDGEEAPANPSRRKLFDVAGRTVPMAAAVGSVGGVAGGVADFVVRREEIHLPDLPEALDGFRIGQLTDVHVGAFIEVSDVRRAVERLDAEGVDLQVVTGDLIDDLDELEGTMQALDAVKARHGTLAVLGNHEHWRGAKEIRDAFARCSRVRLLDDASVVLDHQGAPLRVVGVDYPMRQWGPREEVMDRQEASAFAACQPGETTVCLSHHPDFFPRAAKRGAHLTLSGHTHGGQLAFLGMPVFRFAFRFMLGRYEQDGRHLYVSGGTGHWLPLRMGVPAEVTVLTLRRARAVS